MRSADLFGVFRAWDRYRAGILEYAERFDVPVTPVFASPAPPHGATETLGTGEGLSYLTPFSLTGWPCAVVRCGWSPERLPIGVQCVARRGTTTSRSLQRPASRMTSEAGERRCFDSGG